MAARNRTPLGFGIILAFHLCVLAAGVLLQNLYIHASPFVFGVAANAAVTAAIVGAFFGRAFLWDVLRGFKSAAVLLTLLAASCIMGTLFIQDLDLRRVNVFESPEGFAKGGEGEGRYPEFVLNPTSTANFGNTQSGRFAIAQSFGIIKVFPSDELKAKLEEKVVLRGDQEARVERVAEVFGRSAAEARREAILNSKRREIERDAADRYAKRNFVSRNWAKKHIPNAEEHDVGWFGRFGLYDVWKWTRSLHVFDIFEAWWFYFLLGMIGINVIVGTIARAPWNLRDFGIVVTHAGIITILTGAFIDHCVAKEGYIHFTYGKPELQIASAIGDQKTKTYAHLPFQVRLDRYATEYYHELLVEVVDWDRNGDGKPRQESDENVFVVERTFPIRKDIALELLDGKIKIKVGAYEPRVFISSDIVDAGANAPLLPAAKLGLYISRESDQNLFLTRSTEPWLFAFDPKRSALEFRDSRFEYRYARSEEEYRRLLTTPPLPDNGALVLRGTDGEEQRIPVTLGESQTIRFGGRRVRVTFQSIRSAFAEEENVNLDSRLQRREEPWLYVEVDGTVLGVPRDDSDFVSAPPALKGATFRFDWNNPKDNGVRRIYRVVAAANQPPMLVQIGQDAGVRAEPLRRRMRVALHGLPGYLELAGLVRSATEKRVPKVVTDEEFLREGGDPKRDEALAAWVDLEITGPWPSIRRELTPFDRRLPYGEDKQGRPFVFLRLVKTRQTRDWFSVLSAIDKDGKVQKTHTVQVNSPLRYKGYRFFQATAGRDRDGFGVTGISVTYNPGVWYMYFGFLLLTTGTCWIFFFKPALDKRRRRRRNEARREAAA